MKEWIAALLGRQADDRPGGPYGLQQPGGCIVRAFPQQAREAEPVPELECQAEEEPEADDWIPGRSAATWVPDMAEELEAGS